MIFRQWQQVLDGTKTQVRQLVKEGEELGTVAMADGMVTCVRRNGKIKWYVGQSLAVQPGRGKKAKGRVCITEIRQEQLQCISSDDCSAEGIITDSSGEWITWYVIVPGAEEVWDTKRAAFEALWDSIHKKPGTRWCDNPADGVFVLTFERESHDWWKHGP